jgi:hypothetical protein
MKVFIAGARSLSKLNSAVIERLTNIKNQNFTVLVGDANGVDKSVQEFFHTVGYNNVIVYASNGKVRNNVGNWQIKRVDVPRNVTGFDFYAQKDIQMSIDADYGLMVWNGKSRGTFNNIVNLTNQRKKVAVYVTTTKRFYYLSDPRQVKLMLDSFSCTSTTSVMATNNVQLSL